jgi:hypothetical protein
VYVIRLPHVVQLETLPVSLSIDWGCYRRFFRHRCAVSGFAILFLSAVAFCVFGVRDDMVHDCTWVYGCEPRIHVSKQTAFSSSKLWEWATMVELEPVAHLRFQLAAFHMPASCVKQKSVARRVVV